MAAIKRFFEKRKAEAKFKLAGPGHRLDSSAPSKSSQQSGSHVPSQRNLPSADAQRAGMAAISRLEEKSDPFANRSLQAIKAQVKREMEAEQKNEKSSCDVQKPKVVTQQAAPILATSGVYYKCPLIGDEVLPKTEMDAKIKSFLYSQLEDERGLTACLILYTCNKNKEKVSVCVETLCRYLDNIISNPEEEKYRKIRINNKAFQERVACMEGAADFLLGCGFLVQKLPHQDGEEDFYILLNEDSNVEMLKTLREGLVSAEPIRAELDRNKQVLSPAQVCQRVELPPEFYNLSVEELKREQQLKTEQVERNLMLRTKAMRERDEQREKRKYRFALIRVRFPDGLSLQGTFHVYERFSAVQDFVRENLHLDWIPFQMQSSTGHIIDDADSPLLDLGLVPASILTFTWVEDVARDATTQGVNVDMYLKPETMALVKPM